MYNLLAQYTGEHPNPTGKVSVYALQGARVTESRREGGMSGMGY